MILLNKFIYRNILKEKNISVSKDRCKIYDPLTKIKYFIELKGSILMYVNYTIQKKVAFAGAMRFIYQSIAVFFRI